MSEQSYQNDTFPVSLRKIVDNTAEIANNGGGGGGGGGSPTGPAGGVLSGTYPNPSYATQPVNTVNGQSGPTVTLTAANVGAATTSQAFSWSELLNKYRALVPIRGFVNNYDQFLTGQQPCMVWSEGQTVFTQGTIQCTGTPVSNDRMYNLPNCFEGGSFGVTGLIDNTFNFQNSFIPIDAAVFPAQVFWLANLNSGTSFQFIFNSTNFRHQGYFSGALYHQLSSPTDDVLVYLPPSLPDNVAGVKVCMYFHGLGDDYASFASSLGTDSTQVHFRSTLVALLADGWVVISCSGGSANPATWGNPTSWTATQNALAWIKSICNVTNIVVLGQSMGGVTSLRAAAYYSGVTHWYGVAPATNLAWLYTGNTSFDSSMNTAYSVSDYAGFFTATASTDPMRFPQAQWNGLKMRSSASYDDTVVDRTNNTDALVTRVTGFAASITVRTYTGDHGSPNGYDATDVVTFMNS